MSSTSEKTFGQRLEKARQLYAVIEQLPAYEPSNELIKKSNLFEYLELVENANSRVASYTLPLKDARSTRLEKYFGKNGLKDLIIMIKDFVGTLPNGRKSGAYGLINSHVKKFHPKGKPKKEIDPLTVGGEGSQAQSISNSERSFGSLIDAGRAVLEIIKSIDGYTPANVLISIDNFAVFLNQLEALNNEVYSKLSSSIISANERSQFYVGEDGLQYRFKIAKEFVRSAYGRNSDEFAMVSTIKY